MTTGATTNCNLPCAILIPDTSITYNIKIQLTQEAQDIGFFDAYDVSGITGTIVTPTSIPVTGYSSSRLVELRKYTVTSDFYKQYIFGGSTTSDGVDLFYTNPEKQIVYYLGGIRFVDHVVDGVTVSTTFSLIGQGLSNPNFINKPIYKNSNKENIISNPKIYDDVFIIRQELSAFDNNYKLEFIKSLGDLVSFAAGDYFNIVNNT